MAHETKLGRYDDDNPGGGVKVHPESEDLSPARLRDSVQH